MRPVDSEDRPYRLHAIMARMRTPASLTTAAITLGLALALSACGNDDPKPSPQPPPARTQTTTPPALASSSPDATHKQPTKQGAIDTAVAGVKAIDHAYATWDVQPLKKLATSQCRTCTEIIEQFPKRKAAGYHMNGGRITVAGPPHTIAGSIGAGQFYVVVPITASRLVTHDPSGKLYSNANDLIGSQGAVTSGARFDVEVRWIHERWRIISGGLE